jgi:SulP family sulfate permease
MNPTITSTPSPLVAQREDWRVGLAPNLLAGALSALVTVSYSVSYGALIFSGDKLKLFVPLGLHAALVSACVIALVVAIGSSFKFAIAGPDSNATAILAVMSAAVTSAMVAANASEREIGATVLMLLPLTAILTGMLVSVLGLVGGGRLMRFFPYSVLGGFLAGTGYLVFDGAIKVLTGRSFSWQLLAHPPSMHAAGWLVAFCVAFALLVLPRYYKHYLIMPAVIIGGIALFYISLLITHVGVDRARELGLLFPQLEQIHGDPTGPVAGLSTFNAYQWVRWSVLFSQWQNFLAMTIVVAITILLNMTGLDLATQSDVHVDKELRINGIANLASGLCGGMIGYLSISRSMLNFKAGAVSRVAGLFTATLALGAAFVFSPAVSYLPRPVLAGLLFFLGLSMIREWIWDMAFKLPLTEYLLVVTIMLQIAIQGLIPGIAFGLLIAGVIFVYSYSRTNCIKNNFTGKNYFSNKERPMEQIEELRQRGGIARALTLQGYVFFGTSSAIVAASRELIEREQLQYLLLDFRMVQGLDASAVFSFTKLEQICDRYKCRLLFSGLKAESERVLKQTHFLPKPTIMVFGDLDHGMEWIENMILSETHASLRMRLLTSSENLYGTQVMAEFDLRRMLSRHFKHENLEALMHYCESVKLPENALLFKKGERGDALYFIERGELSVLLQLENGQTKRLRTFGPGTVVGEMALFSQLSRSADVMTDSACRVRKLSADSLARMAEENPAASIELHNFIVKLLCTRLQAANDEIRALQ